MNQTVNLITDGFFDEISLFLFDYACKNPDKTIVILTKYRIDVVRIFREFNKKYSNITSTKNYRIRFNNNTIIFINDSRESMRGVGINVLVTINYEISQVTEYIVKCRMNHLIINIISDYPYNRKEDEMYYLV